MKKSFSVSDLEKICNEVITLAKSTGEFIKQEATSFDVSKIEYKGANDLVSYVDKESEKRLVSGLSKILPEASFITEEGTIDRNQNDLQWVVDPLDGTTNFLHGLPLYSISIALMQNDSSIIGVIYEPNLDECFYGWKDGGAFCNNKPIHVSPVTELNKALIVMGFPYSLLHKQDDYLKIFGKFASTTQGIRRLGSAAIDLAYVSAGRLEGYYEFNLKVWDVAAGILLVQEAGGRVTDFSGGNNFQYGQEVLAAGGVHEEMRKVISTHWF